MRSPRDTLLALAALLVFPAGIALNFLPIAGESPAQAAGEGPTLALNAAGYAFSIWGLIFAWQLVYAVYQALPAHRGDPLLRRVRGWALLNGAGQGVWPLTVVYDLVWASWALILAMLASLLVIEVRTGLGAGLSTRERWLVRAPFAINLGWIAVATILMTATVLREGLGWRGEPLTEAAWAVLMALVAAALGLVMLLRRRAVAFALVTIWALIAIAVGSDPRPVALAAASGAAAVGLATFAVLAWGRAGTPSPYARPAAGG